MEMEGSSSSSSSLVTISSNDKVEPLPKVAARSANSRYRDTLGVLPTIDTYPDFPLYPHGVDLDDDEGSVSDAASAYGESQCGDLETDEVCSPKKSDERTVFAKAIICTELAEAAVTAAMQLPSEETAALIHSSNCAVKRVSAQLRETLCAVSQAQAWTTGAGLGHCNFQELVRMLRAMKACFDEEKAAAEVLSAIHLLQGRYAVQEREQAKAETTVMEKLEESANYCKEEMASLAALLLPRMTKVRLSELQEDQHHDKGDLVIAKVLSCMQMAKVTVEAACAMTKGESSDGFDASKTLMVWISSKLAGLAEILLPHAFVQELLKVVQNGEELAAESVRLITMAITEEVASCKMQRACMKLEVRRPDLEGNHFDYVFNDFNILAQTERMAELAMDHVISLAAVILRTV